MTIECAIKEIKEDIDLYIPLHGTIDDVDRELPDGRLITALEMAIASLEAWEKVIEELRNETDIEVFKPNKECGIYCRMYDVEMLIRKHLQEVTA